MFLKQIMMDGQRHRIELQTPAAALLITTKIGISQNMISQSEGYAYKQAILHDLWYLSFNNPWTINRVSQNGSEAMVQNVGLSQLMELNAFGKSEIRHRIEGQFLVSTGVIYLSNSGALYNDKSQFLVLETGSFQAVSPVHDGASITINALNSFATVYDYLKMESLGMTLNQVTRFDCASAYFVAVPKDSQLLRLRGNVGDVLEFTKEELVAYNTFNTDKIHDFQGSTIPAQSYICVDCALATIGELTATETGNFYLIKNVG